MKIGFLSDLHITNNTTFLDHSSQGVLKVAKENNIEKLFIAGDTSNSYKLTLDFVDKLNKEGLETYTILGNHEYWSISYNEAKKIQDNNYLHGKTVLVNDTAVIGIDGFFDYSFITEVDNEYTNDINKDKQGITDIGIMNFDLSRLHIPISEYESTFDDMLNLLEKQLIANKDREKIVFMHHVPHQNFIIYNEDKIWTTNNAFMGSKKFHELFVQYGVNKVIFGHTHSKFNDIIDNVEYYCNPIGYKSYEFRGTFQERVREMLKVVEI